MCDNELVMKACRPIPAGTPPLSGHDLEHLLGHAEGWAIAEGWLSKAFKFEDHYQTMAFVNAVAWISHREDHHPSWWSATRAAPSATPPTRSAACRRTTLSAPPRSTT